MKYSILDHYSQLKTSGRHRVLANGITFDNTGALLAFWADCEGNVTIDCDIEIKKANDNYSELSFAVIYIDGKCVGREAIMGKAHSTVPAILTVARHLPKGRHLIEVYRQNEMMQARITLKAIELNGTLLERPADRPRYFEFLGDSLTCGFGNLTYKDDIHSPGSPVKSDGTRTYAFMTAQAFDADFSAMSGSGLAFTYGMNGEKPIEDFFLKTCCYRDDTEYDFENARQPDLFVIALGTNDAGHYKQYDYTLDMVEDDAVKLLTLVREKYPKAKIVWAYGMLENNLSEQLQNAVRRFGGAQNGAYFCPIDTKGCPAGGCWHATVKGHRKSADMLIRFIKQNNLL